MKNFVLPMKILLFSAFVWACNDPIADLTPPASADYSIIEGDTVKNRIEKEYQDKKVKEKLLYGDKHIVVGEETVTYKEPKLHTPPAKDPDLSKIKNNDDPDLKGKDLRMVAIGGSLTAGVRDGGYFNEGIITAYPNLIARQMKLKKFEQPLFDKADYNGFGRKVPTTENPTRGPVPKFKAVNNNSGVEGIIETTGAFGLGKTQNISFKKYKNYQVIDNWAVPNLEIGTLAPSGKALIYDWDKNDKTNKGLILRVAQNESISLGKHILNQKFDFFIYEMSGWREVMDIILDDNIGNFAWQGIDTNPDAIFKNPNNEYVQADMGVNIQIKFLKSLVNSKVKYACFLNLPPITKLPYFNIIDRKKVEEITNTYGKGRLLDEKGNIDFTNRYPIPSSEIDSLLSPIVNLSLKKGLTPERRLSTKSFVMFEKAEKFTMDFNKQTAAFAKIFNAPMVDLYSIYSKILAGTYTTDDGVKVDGNYPSGNFFSSDALYPTAFGQAVIANEVIKALNTHYKMEIPLISTRDYLLK